MKELEGRYIVSIYRSGDEMLIFQTDKGLISFLVEGDCCSRSWIEHFEGVEALLGKTVISTEDIMINNVFPRNEYDETIDEHGNAHEYLQSYGVKLTTTAGRAQIEYRNSSNGYYGGWMNEGDVLESLPPHTTMLIEDF